MQMVPLHIALANAHKMRRAKMAAAAYRPPVIKPVHELTKEEQQGRELAEALARAIAHRKAMRALYVLIPMPTPTEPVKVVQKPRKRDVLNIASPLEIVEAKSMRTIMREVCAKHLVSDTAIKSARRQLPLIRARHEFWWRVRNETSRTYPEMALFCGGKDHTSSMNGVIKHQRRIDSGDAAAYDAKLLSLRAPSPVAEIQG